MDDVSASGRLAVAFHGANAAVSCTPFEVFLVTNNSGEWSEERPIAGGDSPSLQLQDGVIHPYRTRSQKEPTMPPAPRPVPNSIHDQCWRRLAGHPGDEAILEMGSDRLPRVMLGNFYLHFPRRQRHLLRDYVVTHRLVLVVEPIPGATPDNRLGGHGARSAKSPAGDLLHHRVQIVETCTFGLMMADGHQQNWSAPSLNVVSIATGPDGAADLVAQGTWYMTNRDTVVPARNR